MNITELTAEELELVAGGGEVHIPPAPSGGDITNPPGPGRGEMQNG